MGKINLIILLIAIAGLVVSISGCVNSNVPSQKSSTPTPVQTINDIHVIDNPTPISTQTVNQYSSMSFTEFEKAMMSNDLTTLQKENLYTNKIFRWTGQVTDVTSDTVTILIREYQGYQTTIQLHVSNDQLSQLNSLSKGSTIIFEGTIDITGQLMRIQNSGFYGLAIDMDNGKIISNSPIIIGR